MYEYLLHTTGMCSAYQFITLKHALWCFYTPKIASYNYVLWDFRQSVKLEHTKNMIGTPHFLQSICLPSSSVALGISMFPQHRCLYAAHTTLHTVMTIIPAFALHSMACCNAVTAMSQEQQLCFWITGVFLLIPIPLSLHYLFFLPHTIYCASIDVVMLPAYLLPEIWNPQNLN